MMSDFDTVLDILECDDSIAHFVWAISWGEDMFQNLDDPFAQASRETLEDQVRV